MGPLLVRFAERAKVPCVTHIDHGADYHLLMKAIKHGFTSIMFDGSALPHDENIQKTRRSSRWPMRSACRSRARSATWASRRARTKTPRQNEPGARERASPDKTRGGAPLRGSHGRGRPRHRHRQHARPLPRRARLDFERLEAIKKAAPCALVLHGGSGISDADFVKAIRRGIRKINIYTAMNDHG